MDYKLYPNLPSAPLENPQVAYHLSVLQAKTQGLKTKEQMFKQKYEKYTKTLNRLMWLNVCSSGITGCKLEFCCEVPYQTALTISEIHKFILSDKYLCMDIASKCKPAVI